MTVYSQRLASLRAELTHRRLDGFIVPSTDEHLSEKVGSYAQRLAWLSGFRGSTGTAVVLHQQAAIFVDGRYTLQARGEVSAAQWSCQSVPETPVAAWLKQHAPAGAIVGYDPSLHSQRWVEAARMALAECGVQLAAVESNPVDAVWSDRPLRSNAPLLIHPTAIAGESSAAKLDALAQWLRREGSAAVVLSALDSIAWLFNVRGTDIPHTPVARAHALVRADASAEIYIDPSKVDDAVTRHLGPAVKVRPPEAFAAALSEFAGQQVRVDAERTVASIVITLENAGARILEARDPIVLPKAIKNATEIAGMKAAHLRDGAALTRFLHWLAMVASSGSEDEMSAAAALRRFREETNALQDLSFATISAAGANAALCHYRPSAESARRIEPGMLYLVDSGGQYLDGTTDVTRTVAIGTPTAEMRDRFTRVLKGHIALACAVFPEGTHGEQLDALARQYLWATGLDYEHGTGHGVGSYLSVHEGPQRIAKAGSDHPLHAGMVVSNEPGYYKAGAYGIRTENLMLVIPRDVPGMERHMLGFETLTIAPIDRTLIDTQMLLPGERAWLNAYHARVYAELGPLVPDEVRAWLSEVTRAV